MYNNESVGMVKIANIAGTNSEAIGASSDDIIILGSFCIDFKGITSVSSGLYEYQSCKAFT